MSSAAFPGNSDKNILDLASKLRPIFGLKPFNSTIIFIRLEINYLPVHNYFGLRIVGLINSILMDEFSYKLETAE